MESQDKTTETQTTSAQPLTGKRSNWVIAHKIETIKGMEEQSDDREIVWTVKGAGTLRLLMSRLSKSNLARAAEHGMVQRISDAAAMARDPKTGASASAQEKYEAMARLVEHYESGAEDWSPKRVEGAGRGAGKVVKEHPQAELLRVALGIHSPEKSAETIAQFVKERNAAQITALVMSELLKEAIELAKEQLRERDAKAAEEAGVNAEELLKGL